MKKLLRCTSIIALLIYFIPFLRYHTSRMPRPYTMTFFDIWFGRNFTVDNMSFNLGLSMNATLAIVFAVTAIACAWLLGNKNLLMRITVFSFSALSLVFFVLTRADFGRNGTLVAALNQHIRGGIIFESNFGIVMPIAVMFFNAIVCLTTEQFAHNLVKYKWWYLMLLPGLVFLAVFAYMPMAGLILMFIDFNVVDMFQSNWVGLRWFREVFFALTSGDTTGFPNALANTVIIAVQRFIITFPAPIILAILITECRGKYYKKSVQTISYLPNFISWSIMGGLFAALFSSQFSMINAVRQALDPNMRNYFMLHQDNTIRSVLIGTGLWRSVGWGSIIFIAALSNVNTELYESARLDGAGKVAQVRHITIPGISPIIVLSLIFAIPGLLGDNLDQAWNFITPLTFSSGRTLSYYIWQVGIRNQGIFGTSGNFSFATTIGFVLSILGFILLMFGNWLGKKINPDGAIW